MNILRKVNLVVVTVLGIAAIVMNQSARKEPSAAG